MTFVTKDSGARAEFDSGMQRDTEEGKARFDLLLAEGVPYEAQLLTRFAELLARGAVKYSVSRPIGMTELVALCSCGRQAATQMYLTTLLASAEAAMRRTCAVATPVSLSANGSIAEPGLQIPSTPAARRQAILRIGQSLALDDSTSDGIDVGQPSDSLQGMATDYLLRTVAAVPYASTDTAHEDLTPTMITLQDLLEGFSVHVATRALDSSATRSRAFGEHSHICRIHRLRPSSDGPLLSGARNWEQADGPDELARFQSSALRHLMQWAAGETDEDHAAAVMFNLLGHETTKYKIEHRESEDLAPAGVPDEGGACASSSR